MISRPLLHITPIHGNPLSNLLPIHTSLHTRMIHNQPNIPLLGNPGKTGRTGVIPTTPQSRQEDGRTTRSPTIPPTKRVNGLTTPNHPFQMILHMTPPPVQSRHFPLNLPTAIAIPNATNDGHDQLNPDNPHSLQGMSPWTFMVAASLDGKQL